MPGVKAALQEVKGIELRTRQIIIHAQVVNIRTEPDSQLP